MEVSVSKKSDDNTVSRSQQLAKRAVHVLRQCHCRDSLKPCLLVTQSRNPLDENGGVEHVPARRALITGTAVHESGPAATQQLGEPFIGHWSASTAQGNHQRPSSWLEPGKRTPSPQTSAASSSLHSLRLLSCISPHARFQPSGMNDRDPQTNPELPTVHRVVLEHGSSVSQRANLSQLSPQVRFPC